MANIKTYTVRYCKMGLLHWENVEAHTAIGAENIVISNNNLNPEMIQKVTVKR